MPIFQSHHTDWGLYTDLYELTMAQGYFLLGRHNDHAVFEYFFRKAPFGGGFVVFAGLSELISVIENMRFSDEAIEFLRKECFKEAFLEYLKDFKFSGTIHAFPEGSVVFPYEPILRVEGPLDQLQIIESVVLNVLNYSSLIATKAARMRLVAGSEVVLADFGMRRAHGLASLLAAYASYIGGFDATSNVLAGKLYGIPVIGTMAHSWVQSFDSEEEAFERFAEIYGEKTVFLVDTYDTLNSGIPNAIKVAKKLEEKGIRPRGIRLDSGDFIELSQKARQMLDEAGLTYMKIIVSNHVDEYLIESLKNANAPIDGYGVGTRLVTAYDQPALDGVYKLVEINGKPRIKISNDSEKVVLPMAKQVYRSISKKAGKFAYDIVVPIDKTDLPDMAIPFYHKDLNPVKIDKALYEYEKMFIVAMKEGNCTYEESTEIKRQRAKEQIERLPDELIKLRVQTYYNVFFAPEIVSEFEKLNQLS